MNPFISYAKQTMDPNTAELVPTDYLMDADAMLENWWDMLFGLKKACSGPPQRMVKGVLKVNLAESDLIIWQALDS